MDKDINKNHWNNIKGVIVFLIVMGEMLLFFQKTPKIITLTKMIYLFHIPILAFVYGFLCKNDEENNNKLFLYYIFGNTILMWLYYLLYGTSFNLIVPYSAMGLFLSFILWKTVIKYCKSIKFLLPFSFLVSLLIGFFGEINNTLAISLTICFLPFFLLGYKLNNDLINKFIKKRKIFFWIIGCLLSIILVFFLLKLANRITLDEMFMSPYQGSNYLVNRFLIFGEVLLIILASILVTPKFKIPFLNNFGENYLYILLYQGPLVLIATKLIPTTENGMVYLLLTILSTIVICFITGNNIVKNLTIKFYNFIINTFKNKKSYILSIIILSIIIITLFIPITKNNLLANSNKDVLLEVMDKEEEEKINNSVSILFAGDLILLKEQVRRGYNEQTKKYDFNSIFDYTKKYIENADLAFGVFEGPMPGEKTGYTTSDYDDGTELHLGFPDEFGYAVKNTGFDLVTLANNHILDKGRKAANRTIDVLDKIGLAHVGASKNNERSSVIIEKDGLKIGVLAYTYGFNYHSEKEALKEKIAPILVDKKSSNFSQVKKQVENDFNKLKEKHPDVIIVMPHMGTQFSNEKDSFQKTWDDIFIENGANIILGDHTHSVQPIEYVKNNNGKNAIIVNSPGNFVNSYQDYYGDANAMVEVYINKDDASVIGSSVIPMWTNSPSTGNYQALPIYEIMNNQELKMRISNNDLNRVNDVYNLITEVMLNNKLSIDNVEEKMYFNEDGYKRKKVKPLKLTDEQMNSELYNKIKNANTIMFIGDSITEGSKNGGYAWYEPMMSNFENKKVINVSKIAYTVKQITNKYIKNMQQADLYVIAIGTNDIRYRNKKYCAMDEKAYIEALKKLVSKIPNKDTAEFVFIAPWLSMSNDTSIDEKLKNSLMKKYTEYLKDFCDKNEYLFINPNIELEDVLNKDVTNKYLVDFIHPNSNKGIYLYSSAVLNASS